MGACDQSSQSQNHDHVKVKINQETIIRASTSNLNSNFKAFPLSNFDLLLIGFPVCFVYVYPNPTKADYNYNSISRTIKSSLSKTLDHFPPFSGQITTNSSGQTEILCNHRGVKLLEVSVDRSLSDLDMHNQTESIHQLTKFPKNHRDFILNVQITSFLCGGFSISWIFDHLLADANAFTMFLTAWCEIATTGESSTAFAFDRSVLKPRSPPKFNRELVELSYTACNATDVIGKPQGCDSATERRLYVVRGSNLETLKASSKKTRTVALSAYLWKLMGKAVGKRRGSNVRCRMGWAVDGRRRMEGREGCLGNFVGNVVLTNAGECSDGDLEERSLEWVADVADGAIKKLANGECFADTMDWVESNRGKVLMHNIVMGDEKPSIVVSACQDMKVMDVDFGFGLPEFAMISLLDLSYGYVNFVSSGRGNGSWFVSALLTSGLAEVLDSDPDRVFEPITNIR